MNIAVRKQFYISAPEHRGYRDAKEGLQGDGSIAQSAWFSTDPRARRLKIYKEDARKAIEKDKCDGGAAQELAHLPSSICSIRDCILKELCSMALSLSLSPGATGFFSKSNWALPRITASALLISAARSIAVLFPGGSFALFPAITADYFGNRKVGSNYGWIFTAYGVAGLAGPLLAGYFKDAAQGAADPQVWMTPFIIAGSICLLGAIVMSLTNRPMSVTRAPGSSAGRFAMESSVSTGQ